MGGAPINNFYTVCGAIPIQLITEVIEYAKTQEYVRTNHTSWREGVVGHSGAIYLITVDGALKEKVHTALAHAFPDFNLLSYDISVTYTLGGRYSFIPWHDDGIHKLAVTLYLNEYWDKDWAGCLLYQDGTEIKAVYPEFNKAILIRTPLQHTTLMPNIQAPLRMSLQVFFT